MDTLIGFISTGAEISGSGDPFRLRRAAVSILYMLRIWRWNLDLREWLAEARKGYGVLLPEGVQSTQDIETALGFIMQRLPIYLYGSLENPACIHRNCQRGRARDQACPSAGCSRKGRSCAAFHRYYEAGAHKRASNILRKQADEKEIPKAVDSSLLKEPAEKILSATLKQKKTILKYYSKRNNTRAS